MKKLIAANGYARAESVSIMLLQRARDAKRSHGTIVHVLNQCMNNTKDIMQQPVLENWRALHQKFYSECDVDPKEVAYLEAEGQAILVSFFFERFHFISFHVLQT